ncbi:MAG: TIGR01777 family oxidoreductase [Ferruginibacter sp.]|nr:TIGR01777 family oxidoreductase [Ferruginibacter sp.]
MQTVAITGGTGLVGKALTTLLVNKGFKVIVFSRKKAVTTPNIIYANWDVNSQQIDITALQQADYIIHLAGAGVMDKKWTTEYKKEIIDSRVKSSELIVNTLKSNPHKVKAIISASAIGFYGEDKNDSYFFNEDDKADTNFLGTTCKLWEDSITKATELNIRVVKLRIGIVFSKDGGAFAEFIKPIKFKLATILGNGKQVISWIHIDDLCHQFLYTIENKKLNGTYNAVAPNPISNKNLIQKLAKKICGNFYIPMYVPSFVLKLMMGDRSIEILKSTRVSSKKIESEGFSFKYNTIDAAFENLV